jgi:hypothetical protein
VPEVEHFQFMIKFKLTRELASGRNPYHSPDMDEAGLSGAVGEARGEAGTAPY